MKKILPWLLLLLLLIIFCVWTKKDSIKLSPKSTGQAISSTTPTEKRSIDYVITQKGDDYHLRGNFTDMSQPQAFTDIFNAEDKKLIMQGTSTTQTLVTDDGLKLTHKILPYFIEHYKNGKIRYDNKTLHVSGTVNSQEEINTMQRFLAGEKDIEVINLTHLDPEAANRTRAAKLAAQQAKEKAYAEKLAREKAEALAQAEAEALALSEKEKADAEALALAEKNAQLFAEEQAQAEALALAEKEKADAQAAREKKEAENAKIVEQFKVGDITFNSGKSTLTPEGEIGVSHIATLLKTKYPTLNIEIAGHTDSDGSEEFNQKLSQARVDTVKSKLMSEGIDEGRLVAKGYGESQPLVPNDTAENKQKNRRVQIKILGE